MIKALSHHVIIFLLSLLCWTLCHTIKLYQVCISPLLQPTCRYVPSCSEYALKAITNHGPVGIWLALKRLVRCHPWGGSGFDPVPNVRKKYEI
jgi:putative membrane protein insertion efficiency factor